MELADLSFDYPLELVATERNALSRVLVTKLESEMGYHFTELDRAEDLASFFKAGDVLVINNTKVLPRRLFTDSHFEILFLSELQRTSDYSDWQVLCPARQWPKNTKMKLPENVSAELVLSGRTQVVRVTPPAILTAEYFSRHGDLPLPPYILKARGEKRARPEDKNNYQTQWAKIDGSLAAPTASLHFAREAIATLKERGVKVLEMTLHVGLGTFLPIKTSLAQHQMHSENVFIPKETWQEIEKSKRAGNKIWALGTTVTRALESAALGILKKDAEENFSGDTDIFIRPGFEFKVIDNLLTNFHQPESTLLALVMAFANPDVVRAAYQHAIGNKFRLFSYGDLSVWIK